MTVLTHRENRLQSDPVPRRAKQTDVTVEQEVETRHPVSSPQDSTEQRRLHPLPRGLVELYGLIAVLVVLIPEWMAEGTLNLDPSGAEASLPMRSRAWRSLPELRLAAMTMAELRFLAHEMMLFHYAMDSRDALTARLLRRLRRHRSR